jgi:hypothetical protein
VGAAAGRDFRFHTVRRPVSPARTSVPAPAVLPLCLPISVARDLPVRHGSVSRFPVALRFSRLCYLAQPRPEFFCSCCGFCANKGHRPIFISCSRPLLALAPRSAAVSCLPLNLGFCSQFSSPCSCSLSWLGSTPRIPTAEDRALPKFLADSPVLIFFCWAQVSTPVRVSMRRFCR